MADKQREESPWAPMLQDGWRSSSEKRMALDGKNYSWPEFQVWYGRAAGEMWLRAGASTLADIDPDARAGASTPADIDLDTRAGASTPARIDPDATEPWSTIRSRVKAINIARRVLTKEWAEYRQKQALLDEDTMHFKIQETLWYCQSHQDALERGMALAEVNSAVRAAAEAIGRDRHDLEERTAAFHEQQHSLDERRQEAVKRKFSLEALLSLEARCAAEDA